MTHTVCGVRFSDRRLAKQAQLLASRLKQADGGAGPGQDQETQFEEAFSQLAFTYLRDRAPALVPHMVGFQLIDRNEDNTKAVGIFGFRLGGNDKPLWLYAPMFFMNNRIKGQNLLYVKNQNRFCALSEKRVNALLRFRAAPTGGGILGNGQHEGVRWPNWRPLAAPPSNFGKLGAANKALDRVVKQAALTRQPMSQWFVNAEGPQTVAHLAYGDLPACDASPIKLAAKHFDGFQVLTEMVANYPQLKQAFTAFYGKEALQKLASDWAHKITNKAAEATSVLARPVKKAEGPRTQRIMYSREVENERTMSELSDDERARLIRDGYLLRDWRTGEEHSVAFNTVQDVALHNPGETGIYDVLTSEGELEKMLVIRNPYDTYDRHPWMTLVRLSSPRSWINCYPTSAFVRTDESPLRDDYRKFFEALPATKELREGGVYCVVTEDGQGTVPFHVREVLSNGQYRVHCHDYSNDEPLRESSAVREYLPGIPRDRTERRYYTGPEIVQFTDRRQTKFYSTGNVLTCPAEAKVLTLEDTEDDCCSDTRSKSRVLQLGDLATLQMALTQKTAGLRVWSDGSETRLNADAPRSQRDALFALVEEYGFPEKEARAMIATAVTNHSVRGKKAEFRVIYGSSARQDLLGYSLRQAEKVAMVEPSVLMPGQSGSNMYLPTFPEQLPRSALNIPSGPQVVESETYAEPIPGLSAQETTDPNTYNMDPMAMPDPMLMQYAQQAAQTGQKELFDAAGLQSMLGTMRRSVIDEDDVSSLAGAVDTLGSLIFKFYWHNDDFEARVGRSDLPALEDGLLNNFEALDELLLMLEEKDLSPVSTEQQGENSSISNN